MPRAYIPELITANASHHVFEYVQIACSYGGIMASPANCCVVCNADLPTAVKRRVIHPCNEANADAHEFFMNVVSPGYTFQSTSVRYVCRTPCFLNLEKAIKHHNALRDLLGSLRGNVAPLTPITKSSLLGFKSVRHSDDCSSISETPSSISQQTCRKDEEV